MGSIQWLAEALFYLDLAPRISGEGITLSDVHGCKATAQGVTLVLSFIPPPQPPLSPHTGTQGSGPCHRPLRRRHPSAPSA